MFSLSLHVWRFNANINNLDNLCSLLNCLLNNWNKTQNKSFKLVLNHRAYFMHLTKRTLKKELEIQMC